MQAVAAELASMPAIDVAFCQRGEADEIIVFVVTDQHSSIDCEALLDTEDRLRERLPGQEIEIRVRARQGRRPSRAAPVGSKPIYAR